MIQIAIPFVHGLEMFGAKQSISSAWPKKSGRGFNDVGVQLLVLGLVFKITTEESG